MSTTTKKKSTKGEVTPLPVTYDKSLERALNKLDRRLEKFDDRLGSLEREISALRVWEAFYPSSFPLYFYLSLCINSPNEVFRLLLKDLLSLFKDDKEELHLESFSFPDEIPTIMKIAREYFDNGKLEYPVNPYALLFAIEKQRKEGKALSLASSSLKIPI